jgi:hypothetical protein
VANRFLAAIRLVLESARRGGYRVAMIGGFALPFHGILRATGDVDFLVEATGADLLHADLLAAGLQALHRTPDVANYGSPGPDVAAVDAVFARRPATRAMLDRAREHPTATGEVAVPVVDVEGIIGLKVQAIANDPTRRRRDEDDIVALLARHLPDLNLALLREYFALFDMVDELDAFAAEARARRD